MPSSRSTTGLPPGVNVGATGPRLLAALVEVGPVWLLTGLALLFGLVLDGRIVLAVVSGVLALAWAIFVWAQRAKKAAGVGMRLDSLQIVGFNDGRPIGWGRVLIRWLVFAGLTVSVVGLIAMAVVMARHPRRQGWHDLAANAVVIKERPLAPPRPKSAVARASAPASGARSSAGASRRPRQAAGGPPTAAAKRPTAVPRPSAEPAGKAAGSSAGVATATDDTATDQAPIDQSASAATASNPTATEETATEQTAPVGTEAEDLAADAPDCEWWLRLDDGRDVGVERLVLLGRNPQPRVGEEDATLIKVVDETRTVSKSHLAVGVDAGGLYVMDRGSTNGTTVTAPDGGQRPCPPGDLIDVPAGSVVSFGDHWLEVRRPGR